MVLRYFLFSSIFVLFRDIRPFLVFNFTEATPVFSCLIDHILHLVGPRFQLFTVPLRSAIPGHQRPSPRYTTHCLVDSGAWLIRLTNNTDIRYLTGRSVSTTATILHCHNIPICKLPFTLRFPIQPPRPPFWSGLAPFQGSRC